MSTATLKPLYHAISEAKRNLRAPLQVERAPKNRQLRRQLAKIMHRRKHREELDEYSVAVIEALILGMLVERMQEGSSGLDEKLYRYSQTLTRKLR